MNHIKYLHSIFKSVKLGWEQKEKILIQRAAELLGVEEDKVSYDKRCPFNVIVDGKRVSTHHFAFLEKEESKKELKNFLETDTKSFAKNKKIKRLLALYRRKKNVNSWLTAVVVDKEKGFFFTNEGKKLPQNPPYIPFSALFKV